jgi:hypothetical protein
MEDGRHGGFRNVSSRRDPSGGITLDLESDESKAKYLVPHGRQHLRAGTRTTFSSFTAF